MNRRLRAGEDGLRPALALAWIRLAGIPVIVAAEGVIDRQQVDGDAFDVVLLAGAAYAVLGLTAALRRPARPPGGWTVWTLADLVILCALIATSGGVESQTRFALAVPPVVAAFVGRPRHASAALAGALAAYVIASAAAGNLLDPVVRENALAQIVFALWLGLLTVLIAIALTRRNDRIADLLDRQRALLARVQETQQKERQELAYALHDEPLQDLFATQLELRRAQRGDREAAERALDHVARVVRRVRGAIFDLHPQALGAIGLHAALEQVAEQHRRLSHVCIDVLVQGDFESAHEELLYSAGRELIVNAVKHAQAARIELSVGLCDEGAVMLVSDDGCGITALRRNDAFRAGHVGLASLAERVAAYDGKLAIQSRTGRGTSVTLTVPQR